MGESLPTEMLARFEEYTALSNGRDDPEIGGMVPQFRNTQMEIPSKFSDVFDRIGAILRLREVQALAGFSRIEPYSVAAERVGEAIRKHRLAPLSKYPKNWLPATEIRGEGIFVRFRTDAIDKWVAQNPSVSVQLALNRLMAATFRLRLNGGINQTLMLRRASYSSILSRMPYLGR